DVAREAVMVRVDDEVEPELRHRAVAERDHVPELPRRVDMQQRKWRLRRPEGLAREMQEDRGILADGIKQHGAAELRRRLAEDMDALSLEELEMRDERGHAALPARCGFKCRPHSFFSSFSHHQRPARGCSPASIARVQGWQPMETKPRAC